MQATAEQQKEWKEYDYGHVKALRELNIDVAKLPNELRSRIRGFNLGLNKINTEEGFHKLVTQSAAIGDEIISWNERDATEDEPTSTEATAATTQATETTPATTQKTETTSASASGATTTTAPPKEELTEEQVLAQHGGGKTSGTEKTANSNPNADDDDGGFFGWDD